MSEPREERRAFDMAKRIREHGPDSLAGMPSEQIAGLLEEIASETRYLRKTRRAVIEKLEQARTDPDPDDREGLVEIGKQVLHRTDENGYHGESCPACGSRSGSQHNASEMHFKGCALRDRLQAQEAGDGDRD